MELPRGVRRRSLLLGATAAVAAACEPDPAPPRPDVTTSASPTPSPSGQPLSGLHNPSTTGAAAFPVPMLYAAAVPDRDLEVFHWDAAKLLRVQVFGTAPHAQAVLTSICGSPDGAWLAWITDGFYLWAAQLGDGKTKAVDGEAEVRGSYPQWLPYGHTLAYTGEGEMFTSTMDGASLVGDRPVLSGYVAWSADGRHFATIDQDGRIVMRSGAGAVLRRRSSRAHLKR